ncbi:hypothetical protein ACNAN0_02445 [Agrilactobacillus fermenti]|uniref:hypothetical protein n=1 Tax=Agrilactobacillus fermenti TaxID=2586909 RepID=UPI001E45237F|nr:hypothetical protein [Agrilactobacillus fermenti]MCD2257498.1 hypothetical protein [Agrilactobacillus fermenti]
MNEDYLRLEEFGNVNVNDAFFDSLRENYKGFDGWFLRKAAKGEKVYVSVSPEKKINAFLYLKTEKGSVNDISPLLEEGKHLKIGTFKINAHFAATGNRFMAIILRKFVAEEFDDVYVTMFPETRGLPNLFKRFGFRKYGTKQTESGNEEVLIRSKADRGDIYADFPKFDLNGGKYLLGIKPEFHTRMVPDSRLNTERDFVREDVSPANSVVKTYLTNMKGVSGLNHGDKIVLYRTKDEGRKAEYSSVATSICVVDEVRNINSFSNEQNFLDFANRGSIFSTDKLHSFWMSKRYNQVIRFLYNLPLKKRITRHDLLSGGILKTDKRGQYFGFFKMTDQEFEAILKAGKVNENFVIN